MSDAQYAELHCLSNFTFLRGAAHPAELVERAHELHYTALTLTDELPRRCGARIRSGA
jgi:error-prone DNA polymerase